jgi:hypothetical protein
VERKCGYFNEIALRITQMKNMYKLWIVSPNLAAMNLLALMDGAVMKSPQIS